jgi:hypothetical protein
MNMWRLIIMNKDIKLGYKIKKWHSKLNEIARQIENYSEDLCLELQRVTDEIDNFMHEKDKDTNVTKVKNIISFLCIIFSEDELIISSLFDKSPMYVIEKYERYIESEKEESNRGMHRNLIKHVFNPYCKKWKI